MGFDNHRNWRDEAIVISGLGCLTPLGNTREDLWDGFRRGLSGVDRIQSFDPSPCKVQIAGEVRNLDPFENLPPKERQHVSRTAALAIGATHLPTVSASGPRTRRWC